MEILGKQTLWSYVKDSNKPTKTTCDAIRKGPSHNVESYLELATKVAELNFLNRDYVLLYRGQDIEYKDSNRRTTLKPCLFRPKTTPDRVPPQSTLESRFYKLSTAERLLIEHYERMGFDEVDRLKRQRILRWSILQHYQVSSTPLLDVTSSLRIAASFASIDNETRRAFLYVLGVPNLSGAITASAESGLQIVRLSSVCPPAALRPHIQEGYLLGEYPDMAGYDQKQHYHHYEIDFGRRLLAKFRFNPRTFWKDDNFPMVAKTALYPNNNDPLFQLAQLVTPALAN